MQTNEILNLLKNKNVQEFVEANLNNNTSKLALKFAGKVNFNLPYVLKYLKLLQKAKTKLPTYYNNRCFLTPKSFEQSTSEGVAMYKANFINCVKLLNLTGGLGVDDWAFSKTCDSIISVDLDNELNLLVNENIRLLNTPNIKRITADAYHFVKETKEKYDIIYIDPDRRDENTRVYSLADSVPDYFKLEKQLLKLTDTIIIKASPMLDITELSRSIIGLNEIMVIAEENEVKELLLFISSLKTEDIKYTAVNINKGKPDEYSPSETANEPEYGDIGTYFMEPNKAIIKAGLARQYAIFNNVKLIHPKAAYMLADAIPKTYQGRVFEIIQVLAFKPKLLKKQLKERGIKKANIAKRNFRESVDELYKLTNLKEGGETYLFFTTSLNKEPLVYITSKV